MSNSVISPNNRSSDRAASNRAASNRADDMIP